MGIINVNQVSAQQGIKFQGFTGENNYPQNLGTSDAGFLIYDTSLAALVIWDGTNWSQVKMKGAVNDGTESSKANGSAMMILVDIIAAGGSLNDVRALEGPLWLNPAAFSGSNPSAAPFQVWCDMTTQGGGWTLSIKYDRQQVESTNWSVYSLEDKGGREYYNHLGLSSLDANGAVYETLNMRDLIICNKALGNGYAGRWMMHACTDQGSGAGRLEYTGSDFNTPNQASQSRTAGSSTTLSHSPMFSQFHKNIIADPDRLWDTDGAEVTNSSGGSPTTYQDYQVPSDITQYGGGTFYKLGDDATSPSEDFIMTNASYIPNSSDTNGRVLRQDFIDGNYMFSVGNREGGVYCSGTNNSNLRGHQSPAFNWGFHSKDNSQQTYGYGSNTTIGTHCNSNSAGNYRPGKRMNFMFTR